jgi:dCMP deaminase
MQIAENIAIRSNCIRPAKGAIIVKNKQIISTGYNGTPSGTKNCIDGGCARCIASHNGEIASGTYNYDKNSTSECTCCHAEENAIVHAAKHGISTEGATIYTSFFPCTWCSKMIINAGIVRIVAKEDYFSVLSKNLLKQAKVKLENINDLK